jgi:hypothetical protein
MRHAGKMWLVGLLLVAPPAFAQSAPPTPNRPWSVGGEVLGETRPGPALRFDPTKTYSLAEIIDMAQRHHPDTRVSWERARAQAAALGVARSELYPPDLAAAQAEFDLELAKRIDKMADRLEGKTSPSDDALEQSVARLETVSRAHRENASPEVGAPSNGVLSH